MMNNEKMKKCGFTRKILDEFQGLQLLLLYFFFVEIFDDFHDCVSECVSFPEENQQPVLGSHRVFP